MGLGKTTQAIAACHALFHAGIVRRGLIVTPASLKAQWLREWERTTDVPAVVVSGGADERAEIYRKTTRGFLIVNYEIVLRDFASLIPFARDLAVLDEAQRIKNYATKSAVFIKALPSERRLELQDDALATDVPRSAHGRERHRPECRPAHRYIDRTDSRCSPPPGLFSQAIVGGSDCWTHFEPFASRRTSQFVSFSNNSRR